jgi:hypothetical protein
VLQKIHCETGKQSTQGRRRKQSTASLGGRGAVRCRVGDGSAGAAWHIRQRRKIIEVLEGIVCREGDGSIARLRDAFPG